jgi:hypothetical protein
MMMKNKKRRKDEKKSVIYILRNAMRGCVRREQDNREGPHTLINRKINRKINTGNKYR